MFQIPYIKELTSRFKEPKKHIQVIIGHHQMGKTTLSSPYTY